jgi:exopolyphosphatase / guanosine-5'-triphosphate,3'-diphosphate pyrophosphatase
MNNRFIAAIDIGTNSFHLLLVKILGQDFKVVHHERKVLRLRESSNSDNHIIDENKITEAKEVLRNFKSVIDSYNAETFAIATSALRDASNKEDVCKKIFDAIGIRVKILSGEEEAILVFKAALHKKEISRKKVLIFDLGGGSTELIIGQGEKIIYKTSLQLGAVRFTQKYFPDFNLSVKRIENFREGVNLLIKNICKSIVQIGFDYCIGIGGTITSVSWLIEKNVYGRDHNFSPLSDYVVVKKDFDQVKELVLDKKTIEERALIKGMELKRADILPAGILIIDELFSALHLKEVIASGFSIKEGVVIDAIQKSN